ncbi:MAG: translocation/assembly module TamB domain-containing protein [Treponema sp.]|nr:translocation/assembly module TamB domain-containing protein [Treponema sp.]
MGFLYSSKRIRSYVLILLAVISLIIAGPVRSKLNSIADKKLTELTDLIHDSTGLSISYKSLSPSILSNLYIKGIDVSDDNGLSVLTIERTRINYNLIKLLKGDFNAGISNVVIDGILLDLDKIVTLAEHFSKNESSSSIDFMQIKENLPSNISLKNISLKYEHELFSAQIGVKNFSLSSSGPKNLLAVQLASSASATINQLNQNFSCRLEASGTFTDILDNSQLNLKISDLTNGDVRLNKLNLHAEYNDSVIALHTIQSVNPIALGADINLKTGDINAQVKSQNLNPLALVHINSRQKEMYRLKGLSLTTDSILKINYLDNKASYVSDTSVNIPPQILPDGAELNLSFYGSEKSAELTNFSLKGKRYSADAALSFVFKSLQLSGYFDLPYLELPNGTSVSTEIYFDPLSRGFKAFSPQIFLGEKSLTALELSFLPQDDSFDFLLDVYDYSHSDESIPGLIHLDGSYLTKSNYVQSNLSLNSIYLDSLALFAAQVMDEKNSATVQNFSDKLSPYVLTGDAYISTDLKSISYNVPYVMLANTRKDNQALLFALNGTEENIQLNQFSLVLGSYAMEATASLDKNPDTSDVFFDINMNSGSIPYHLSGTYMPELFTLTGDYGFDFQLNFPADKSLNGHLMMENYPFVLGALSFVFTTDLDFRYDSENGPSLQVVRFEAEQTGTSFSVSPRIVMSGTATKYGAQINSISYTDFYSALEGSADLMLNMNSGIFDSVGIAMNVKNPLSDEGIILDGTISNPDHLPFTMENLTKYIYINLQLQMNAFSLNRFIVQQHENNMITGSLFASGTLEHPYVSLNVEDASMFITSSILQTRGNITLEEKDLTVSDLNLFYEGFKLTDVSGTASLEDMTLSADGNIFVGASDRFVEIPVTLTVGNSIIPENGFIPDSFSASLVANDIKGNLIKKKFPIELALLYAEKRFSFYSSDNIGLSGSYSLDGILEMNLDNKSFAQAKMDGFVNSETANLELYDLSVDLRKLNDYLALDDLIIFEKGTLAGTAIVTGSFADPELNGFIMIDSPEVKLPSVTAQKLSTANIAMNIQNNEIDLPATIIKTKKGNQLEVAMNIFLNKWSLEHVSGSLKTLKKDMFPIKLNTPLVRIDGDISTDIQLYFEDSNLDVSGYVFGENINISSGLGAVSAMNLTGPSGAEENKAPQILVTTDLELVLGTHASINFDPILRCVFVPNTRMQVKINQDAEEYIVEGNLQLKSGDIAYLNRSFYIKSGNVKFNTADISNPQITINAETREKDERGQNVKIIMDVENQFLSNLNPRFSSVPAKSENEIRSLLGQIAVADSSSATNFLFAASDYAIQSTVVRQAENKLRDLLNFDIFSVRTNVLQNTLNMGVSGALTKENISIGNFLDNSTVYIGKYLANSLYVDAMLHVSFGDGYVNDINSAGSLVFQPEFGMELESPFANIRVNLAPDINALLQNQFVPSPSLTLSWKYAF